MPNLYVRDFKTRSLIHTINVTGKSWNQVEKIELGMLRNMDTEKYFIDDDEAFKELTHVDEDVTDTEFDSGEER